MGTDETTLRFARPSERAALEPHPDAIELPAEQIAAGLVRVAEQAGALAGFSLLLERSGTRASSTACSSSRPSGSPRPARPRPGSDPRRARRSR